MTKQLFVVNKYDINGKRDQSRYTDWQKVLIGGTAKMTDINASVSGGNNETQFLFGAGYKRKGQFFREATLPTDFQHISPLRMPLLTKSSIRDSLQITVLTKITS